MNMFKPVKATNVKEYLKSIPPERQEDFMKLHDLIQKTVPKLKVHFASNMIGYGSFPYLNYKKEKIQWPTIALANKKSYISLYVCSVVDGEYVAEKNKDSLGKVKVGKSCINIKNVKDVDLTVLKKVLKQAAKNPGLR